MANGDNIRFKEIINSLKGLRSNIKVPTNYKSQVAKVDILLNNDKTGMVSTVVDFMVNTANVDLKIESKNKTLNKQLEIWQESLLNHDLNIDIPSGLRELSSQYFRERWRSSFIGLKVKFEEVDFGGNLGKFEMPTKMWLVDGAAIEVKKDDSSLTGKSYSLKTSRDKSAPLNNKDNEMIFIRKPYNLWHEDLPTPFLVKKGVLFNALLKNAITQKQADAIEVIIPYLLKIQSGSDRMAELDLLPSQEELIELKQKFVEAQQKMQTEDRHDAVSQYIASLSHDTNVEQMMPDLGKVFNPSIMESVDRNILSGLGLVDMVGFSKTRQEAVLNPKVLVEEVRDAVTDWTSLLEEVMMAMMLRNMEKHNKLANSKIQVIPTTIKAFVTDSMRTLMRSLYDRGTISKKSMLENGTDLMFEVEIDRRTKEKDDGLNDLMYPPIIQNFEQHLNDTSDNEILDDRQPDTPESDNFNQAALEFLARKHKDKKKKNYSDKAVFETIEDLPSDVTSSLPVPAQMIWLRVFNDTFEKTGNKERSTETTWSVVSQTYKKSPGRQKWVKI